MTCDHDRMEVTKRARESVGYPDAWADAIIERCLDCGAYHLDNNGRRGWSG